ncbi:tRNA uridine(34) 5-carboxymethylaminomethyl modification radical SAM/GNAT enzyme Elp3, partial [Candidatus Bathyarchaeota archaeon]|nr:tRNA uridine(34) 5-carboxymethylaminomethyl modification radical SAM/GNAT enzyme Elp3 [Candidatus Bathyarchaeota archaeon]
MESSIFKDIIESLMDIPNPSREDVNRVKVRIAEKYRLNYVPSNSEIIRRLSASQRAKLLKVLRRKNVRVASGVTVIAAMTKPW